METNFTIVLDAVDYPFLGPLPLREVELMETDLEDVLIERIKEKNGVDLRTHKRINR